MTSTFFDIESTSHLLLHLLRSFSPLTMSVARPSQCIFCTFRRSTRLPLRTHRTFTTTRIRPRKDDEDEGPTIDIPREGQRALNTPIEKWKKGHYTPEQLEAIRLASEVIPKDAFDEGKNPDRNDPWAVEYYDSYEHIDPTFDKPVMQPWSNIDDTARMKNDDEIDADIAKLIAEAEDTPDGPEDEGGLDWEAFGRDLRLTTGTEAHEKRPRTALQPSLPVPKKKRVEPLEGEEEGARAPKAPRNEEASAALVTLMQMTGYTQDEIAKLRVKSLIMHRVVNQTRLGKISKQYFLSVAGNGNGLLGIGEGKSEEPSEARLQSQYRAIRNMVPILRYENRTIYGDVKAKVSATELELMARPPGKRILCPLLLSLFSNIPSTFCTHADLDPGFGLRCQQYIWEMCKCAGIHDLAARVTRARNPMNTVKAAFRAFTLQKDPEDIARARGKKLVDVRRVYYAGQV